MLRVFYLLYLTLSPHHRHSSIYRTVSLAFHVYDLLMLICRDRARCDGHGEECLLTIMYDYALSFFRPL